MDTPPDKEKAVHDTGLNTTQSLDLPITGPVDLRRAEAPVTLKAYLLCAFASLGGIFFGYDSGYINNVDGLRLFYQLIDGPNATALTSSHNSLIVSILSAGTFFGSLMAGDIAEYIGRKWTIVIGCVIYTVGVAIQCVTGAGDPLPAIVTGRLVAGFGVGFVSAIIILYMSEICPKRVRGALVSLYQFFITIGLMTASCVVYGTEKYSDSGAYRIPIAIQFIWAIILGSGLIFLPDSPRYFIKRAQNPKVSPKQKDEYLAKAAHALSRVRDQPEDSQYITEELEEIRNNEEYERSLIPETTWFGSWAACFKGSLWSGNSNLRKVALGIGLQCCQQLTGVNFIFYYSTVFLQSTGAISNTFLISLIFTIINVFSTPFSFYGIERLGRRTLLVWGALGMIVCQFIVAIVGVTVGFNHTHPDPNSLGGTLADNKSAVNAQISFIAIFIFFFASTWGPCAWVVIGEIFPIPIRSRGVALATASNWLWNCIIAVITPYMVDKDKGYLRSSVFFIWGGLCTCAFLYAYFLVPETKGLSLEQVDQMMEETIPRKSAAWVPHETFANKNARFRKPHEHPAAVHEETV